MIQLTYFEMPKYRANRILILIRPLGSTTIQIQNSSTLDYETNPEIVLILEARDTAELSIPLYGYTKVTVTLQDANDNAPQFSQDRYSSSVSEGNEPGTFVTQVRESSKVYVILVLLNGNPLQAFSCK